MTTVEEPADAAAAAARPSATVCLLDADAEMSRTVPAGDHPLARRALNLRELVVAAGQNVEIESDDAFALVVVEGTVWREVRLGDACAPQLLDGGAVLLREPPAPGLLVPASATVALTDARMAVLDRRFLLAATRWPDLMAVLHRRLAEQQRDGAALAAIAHLPRVEERVEYLLWHLAERWGRVCADGVHLGLHLTHATLGRFVGARRPTVSLAIAQLRERGGLERTDEGTWVLLGDPPSPSPAAPEPPRDLV
jgi:CRP/FNR family transcriptional regulator, cyclic AMP receptor protein